MPILSRNVDKKSLKTEFSIAICRHTGDKWQSKIPFISIFYPPLSIVDSVFDCHLHGMYMYIFSRSPHRSVLLNIIFIFLNQNICCKYSKESSH